MLSVFNFQAFELIESLRTLIKNRFCFAFVTACAISHVLGILECDFRPFVSSPMAGPTFQKGIRLAIARAFSHPRHLEDTLQSFYGVCNAIAAGWVSAYETLRVFSGMPI